jgi:hypothetical protein
MSLTAIKICAAALTDGHVPIAQMDIWCVIHIVVLVKAWVLALCFVCASVLAQHLMMWAVFAPKVCISNYM